MIRTLAISLIIAWVAASTASAAPPRVTVIGDSVQASFNFSPQARSLLGRGLDLRVDARVCRRLISSSCSYQGTTPEPALSLIRRRGAALGEVVVVNVGYNDGPGGYDVEAVLEGLRASGVTVVVWVTLREARASYATTNALIRAASREAARSGGAPVVRVADWNAFSAGRPWFAGDGLHLSSTGAVGLAGLLRESVLAGLADAGVSVDGRPVSAPADVVPLGREVGRIAGDHDVLWLAGAGRLSALAPRSGRRLPGAARLEVGEILLSDGRQAWLGVAERRIVRPAFRAPRLRGRAIEGLGPRPLLARAGRWLWSVRSCPEGPGCLGGQVLVGVRPADGERHRVGLRPGRVRGAAASARALWLLVATRAGTRARLEQRDPRTGRLVRTTPLPRRAATGSVTAGRHGAWVLTGNDQLLSVRGRSVRRVTGRVAAVASVDDQLWALRSDRRTVENLHPASARVRSRAVSPHPLSARLAFTRGHVWLLAASGRRLTRIPRALPGASRSG